MSSDAVVDPTLDPTATYAVDPARVRRLATRVAAGDAGGEVTTYTPMTGAPIGVFPLSSVRDVDAAFAAARARQPGWAARSVAERRRVLLRFHDLVLDHRDDLLDAVQLEAGKARLHAFEEVADVALVARHYGRAAGSYLRPRRRVGALPLLTSAREQHLPRGVVGVVSPWNYPLSLAAGDALPALVAGNGVVLRPDLQGSLSALLVARLLAEAGLPDGLLQVVLGDGAVVGRAVVDRADYVCFTGSTATGREVARSAARRLVGASLELGGKNSLYVAADADLDRAVRGAVRGCFSSAGQLCVSAERVIVHEAVADEFERRFLRAVRRITVSTDLAWGADMGSLVSRAQLDRVTAHVEDARRKGARVLAGGRARPDIGPYVYEPTVLAGVTAAMDCRDEETFGPVAALYRVPDDEAAIRLANDTEYGLNASVWTRDTRRGRALAGRIRAGTVNVNEAYAAAWASVAAPMGGMKASGLSRRHGAEGLLKYTESQTVAVQRLLPLAPPPGVEDRRWAGAMTSALRALRALGAR